MHSFNSRRKFLINTTLFSSTVIFNSCYGFENEFIGHGDFKSEFIILQSQFN